ncbi:MAG: siphovirus Gp157 family protein [Acidimicrobiia bacterium]
MSHAMIQELTHHQYLRVQLEAEFPDADEETLLDTLEGMTNLAEMLAEVLRSCLADQDLASALRTRIGDMQERLSRFEERALKKRGLVTSVMEEAGLKRIMEPDLTVSLRPSRPPLMIIDEAAIPRDFLKSQPDKLDRLGLIAALRDGRDIPGAVLGNPPMTISVRTK